jgi:uncharacterized protein (TIGR02145 family)
MKNLLLILLVLVAFSSNAQQIIFQRHNNYVGPAGSSISATKGLSYLTSTSAQSGGIITSDGGNTITAKGVVWSTSSGPTVALSTKTNDGSGVGTFTSTLTGLTLNTVYYIRSYATNSVGTSYGPEVSIVFINTVTSSTGKIWMDRNLGATQVATSNTDASSFGDLYQWGRSSDGHQLFNSTITSTQFSSTTTNNGNYVAESGQSLRDWIVPSNPNLWQGVNGINNPCPKGFRIPTKQEWTNETATWSSQDANGAYASPLKLPYVNNLRCFFNNGAYAAVSAVYYWTSNVDDVTTDSWYLNKSYALKLEPSAKSFPAFERGYGFSCRCIQDY